jgi:hypothetical protein
VCEQIPYSVVGAECNFEVCWSKYVDNVGSLFTCTGEVGPLFLRCLGHLFSLGVWVGCLWGLMGKESLWRMLWMMFSSCQYCSSCRS